MSPFQAPAALRFTVVTLACLLASCGGSDTTEVALPGEPAARLGAESVLPPAIPAGQALPFVDFYRGNQGGTYGGAANIALRDASVNPAVALFTQSFGPLWTPAPNTGVLDNDLLLGGATALGKPIIASNWDYTVRATTLRTGAQELFAWLIDGQNANYAMIAALGNAAATYKTLTQASSRFDAISTIPANASTVRYQETSGADWGRSSATLGSVPALVSLLRGPSSSSNPAKNAYVFPRAYLVEPGVSYPDSLLPRRANDGGFPSGHTNAAFLASLAMAYAMPERYQELLVRASELGESRIWASHHSPVDIIGGRVLATALSAGILNDAAGTCAAVGLSAAQCPDTANPSQVSASKLVRTLAREDAQRLLGSELAVPTTSAGQREIDRQTYRARLTYGLPRLATPPVETAAPVPKGAEVLLETRFPYLSGMQRRAVLRSTALPNVHPVTNDVEGWGRLNLFDAADGYATFTGDVTVTMDLASGGYAAADTWRNDIAGPGLLTKAGTGTLRLSGSNSYSGGTLLQEGGLGALSGRALGTGLVYVKAGKLWVQAPEALTVGSYAQTAAGALHLTLGAGTAGALRVSGAATVTNDGSLVIEFASGFRPAVGQTINVLSAERLSGRFRVSAPAGYLFDEIYSDTGLALHVRAIPGR